MNGIGVCHCLLSMNSLFQIMRPSWPIVVFVRPIARKLCIVHITAIEICCEAFRLFCYSLSTLKLIVCERVCWWTKLWHCTIYQKKKANQSGPMLSSTDSMAAWISNLQFREMTALHAIRYERGNGSWFHSTIVILFASLNAAVSVSIYAKEAIALKALEVRVFAACVILTSGGCTKSLTQQDPIASQIVFVTFEGIDWIAWYRIALSVKECNAFWSR